MPLRGSTKVFQLFAILLTAPVLIVIRWMSSCIGEELPPASELEKSLQNGVFIAKLAMFFAPEKITAKKIYDFDESVYKVCAALDSARYISIVASQCEP